MISLRTSAFLAAPMVAAAAAAVAVVVSSLPASSASTASVALAPRMNAVDLANGLLFNQGRAAPYLAALDRPSTRLSGKLLAVERSVDHSLRAHPAMAATFAHDVQSGNRVKVDSALTSLSRLTRTAFDHEYGAAATRRMAQRAVRALNNPAQLAPDDGSGGGCCNQDIIVIVAYDLQFVALINPVFDAPDFTSDSRAGLVAARMANLVAVSLRAAK